MDPKSGHMCSILEFNFDPKMSRNWTPKIDPKWINVERACVTFVAAAMPKIDIKIESRDQKFGPAVAVRGPNLGVATGTRPGGARKN